MNSTIDRLPEPDLPEEQANSHPVLLGNSAKNDASLMANAPEDPAPCLPLWEITKSVFFEAAHCIVVTGRDQSHGKTSDDFHRTGLVLPAQERKKRYGQIHGHSFRLEISLRAQLQPGQPWVEDFDAVSRALEMVRAELDHTLLNDIPGLEIPTLEHICRYVSERLRPQFPNLARIVVERPSLGEKCEMRLNG